MRFVKRTKAQKTAERDEHRRTNKVALSKWHRVFAITPKPLVNIEASTPGKTEYACMEYVMRRAKKFESSCLDRDEVKEWEYADESQMTFDELQKKSAGSRGFD